MAVKKPSWRTIFLRLRVRRPDRIKEFYIMHCVCINFRVSFRCDRPDPILSGNQRTFVAWAREKEIGGQLTQLWGRRQPLTCSLFMRQAVLLGKELYLKKSFNHPQLYLLCSKSEEVEVLLLELWKQCIHPNWFLCIAGPKSTQTQHKLNFQFFGRWFKTWWNSHNLSLFVIDKSSFHINDMWESYCYCSEGVDSWHRPSSW